LIDLLAGWLANWLVIIYSWLSYFLLTNFKVEKDNVRIESNRIP